jgi:hypothetical protein
VRASKRMRFHSMPSATGGIARLVAARLRAAGIALAPLLSRAGLTVEQIDDAGVRLPVQSQIKLLELAAEALHDDLLGFHLAEDYELREIGLFYYVLASSEILADALHRAERYSGIVNEGFSLQARIGKETAIVLTYVNIDRRSDRHQIEILADLAGPPVPAAYQSPPGAEPGQGDASAKKDARRIQIVSRLRDRIRIEP